MPNYIASAASFLTVVAIEEPGSLKGMVGQIELFSIKPSLCTNHVPFNLVRNDEARFVAMFGKEFLPIHKHLFEFCQRLRNESAGRRFSIWLPDKFNIASNGANVTLSVVPRGPALEFPILWYVEPNFFSHLYSKGSIIF